MRGISEGKLQRRYPVLHKEDRTVSYRSFSPQEWIKHAIFVPVGTWRTCTGTIRNALPRATAEGRPL